MSDEKLNMIIKETFQEFEKEPQSATRLCPPDEELAHYTSCALSGESVKETLLRHISECDSCFTKIASAASALTGLDKNMPDEYDSGAIQKAKSIPRIYRKNKKGYVKRNRYLFIAAGFFVFSFIFKAYFLQFLAAASIFGLKWVMDTGGSKALIMIYDTWQYKRVQRGEEEKRPSFTRPRNTSHL